MSDTLIALMHLDSAVRGFFGGEPGNMPPYMRQRLQQAGDAIEAAQAPALPPRAPQQEGYTIPTHLQEPWTRAQLALSQVAIIDREGSRIAVTSDDAVARAIVALPRLYEAMAMLLHELHVETLNKKVFRSQTRAAMDIARGALSAVDGQVRK